MSQAKVTIAIVNSSSFGISFANLVGGYRQNRQSLIPLPAPSLSSLKTLFSLSADHNTVCEAFAFTHCLGPWMFFKTLVPAMYAFASRSHISLSPQHRGEGGATSTHTLRMASASIFRTHTKLTMNSLIASIVRRNLKRTVPNGAQRLAGY